MGEEKIMWEVDLDENGSYVASWGDSWLPNTYQSREDALEALCDYAAEWME